MVRPVADPRCERRCVTEVIYRPRSLARACRAL